MPEPEGGGHRPTSGLCQAWRREVVKVWVFPGVHKCCQGVSSSPKAGKREALDGWSQGLRGQHPAPTAKTAGVPEGSFHAGQPPGNGLLCLPEGVLSAQGGLGPPTPRGQAKVWPVTSGPGAGYSNPHSWAGPRADLGLRGHRAGGVSRTDAPPAHLHPGCPHPQNGALSRGLCGRLSVLAGGLRGLVPGSASELLPFPAPPECSLSNP